MTHKGASIMPHNEAAALIGKVREIEVNGLAVDVMVNDVKQAYGRTRYLVSPVAGRGQVWVERLV